MSEMPLPAGGFLRLSLNPRSSRRAYGPSERDVLDPDAARTARAEIRGWPEYAPTPLHALPGLAGLLGVRSVRYKDESTRFGLGAFKALGGAYAVLTAAQDELERRTGARPSAQALLEGRVPEASEITTTTASAGNHGRAVAWGSQRIGCRCVVYLPADVTPARAGAIRSHGARVVVADGDYDQAVSQAQSDADEAGWLVISDTSYEGYTEIPRRVMEGYTVLAEETLEALDAAGELPPTHVLVQAGVGGLATGLCGGLWSALGSDRPIFVGVEPVSADCFSRSIRSGRRVRVGGPFPTMMGGLASGVPSILAWRLLSTCLDAAIAILDDTSRKAMRALASGELGHAISAGESGAAGVGVALELSRLVGARRLIGLDDRSRVLTLGTEGPIDPSSYARIVGEDAVTRPASSPR